MDPPGATPRTSTARNDDTPDVGGKTLANDTPPKAPSAHQGDGGADDGGMDLVTNHQCQMVSDGVSDGVRWCQMVSADGSYHLTSSASGHIPAYKGRESQTVSDRQCQTVSDSV